MQAAKDTPAAKATFSRLESRVFAEQRGLRMTNFLTTEPGVTPAKTRIKPVGRAKSWPSAFFLKLRNTDGKLGLFVRKNGKLKHIYGPSASQVFTEVSDEIAGPMQQFLIERLDKTTADVLRQYSE